MQTYTNDSGAFDVTGTGGQEHYFRQYAVLPQHLCEALPYGPASVGHPYVQVEQAAAG